MRSKFSEVPFCNLKLGFVKIGTVYHFLASSFNNQMRRKDCRLKGSLESSSKLVCNGSLGVALYWVLRMAFDRVGRSEIEQKSHRMIRKLLFVLQKKTFLKCMDCHLCTLDCRGHFPNLLSTNRIKCRCKALENTNGRVM